MSAAGLQVVAAGAAACLLISCAGTGDRTPLLLLNTTASVPVGLYIVSPRTPKVGDLAVVQPHPDLALWMARRQYLPMGVPLLKEVAATTGARVCGVDGVMSINGAEVGRARSRDRLGRPLSAFSGCQTLTPQEIFLFNAKAEASLDSRYFGPVPRSAVLGLARPFWTWER